MPKTDKRAISKKYLKILGIVTIILSIAFAIIAAISIFNGSARLEDLGIANLDKLRESSSDDVIRTSFGVATIISGGIGALVGWFFIRASKNPNKSTAALVLAVLSMVGSFTAITNGKSGASVVVANALSLVVYILALIALLEVRKERYE